MDAQIGIEHFTILENSAKFVLRLLQSQNFNLQMQHDNKICTELLEITAFVSSRLTCTSEDPPALEPIFSRLSNKYLAVGIHV